MPQLAKEVNQPHSYVRVESQSGVLAEDDSAFFKITGFTEVTEAKAMVVLCLSRNERGQVRYKDGFHVIRLPSLWS